MSKEQTQITAEEFLDAKGFSMDDFRSEQRYLLIRDLMEQYAQAKVLEALEREIIECWLESFKESFRQEGRVCDDEFLGLAKNDAKRYYETEAKPKYK